MSVRTGVTSENIMRLGIGFILVIVLFAVLLFRVAYWQIVRAEDLNEKATEMQDEDTSIEPVRGTIYDSKMNALAQTVTKYEVYAYTQSLYKDKSVTDKQRKEIIANLVKYTGEKEADIKEKLEGEEIGRAHV